MTTRVLAILATGTLLAMAPTPAFMSPSDPAVFKPNSTPFGHSYAEWSAGWWTYVMEHPMFGHPAIDDGNFDVASGQSGDVWFLASPLDLGPAVPRTRSVTVPADKGLFVGLLNAETSSLEGTPDEADQRAASNFIADHIVDPACTIDGDPVDNIADYRFESPQFSFTAPDPWIFGPAGAGETGTSVAAGYYVFVKPPKVGTHTLHLTGSFHFEPGELGNDEPFDLSLDMTYLVTVSDD